MEKIKSDIIELAVPLFVKTLQPDEQGGNVDACNLINEIIALGGGLVSSGDSMIIEISTGPNSPIVSPHSMRKIKENVRRLNSMDPSQSIHTVVKLNSDEIENSVKKILS